MTAVRRADVSRSPMLKVMDLFRHRSNSAVSEADKRKAVSFSESFFKIVATLFIDIERHLHVSLVTNTSYEKSFGAKLKSLEFNLSFNLK